MRLDFTAHPKPLDPKKAGELWRPGRHTSWTDQSTPCFAHAINRLPDECREVVALRTVERLTHKEVGARLGFTKKQAEKRLHRAMRLLHAALNPAADGSVADLPPRDSAGGAAR